MIKKRVVYICHFSTSEIRAHLKLRSFGLGNFMRRIANLESLKYCDSGTWNADFIKAFENNEKYDCYVLLSHIGMTKREQRFQIRGAKYIIFREQEMIMRKVLNHIRKKGSNDNYDYYNQYINNIVDAVNPDIVILCGAENEIYSPSILAVENKPIFVLLQTLLNLPKRVEMGIGSMKRREIENAIFRHANYFGTIETEEKEYITQKNHAAHFLKLMFPSSPPVIVDEQEKLFDFVFFANGLSKHKGTEDAIRGFMSVVNKHPSARMNVIGYCDEHYKGYLTKLLKDKGILENVTFHDHFPLKEDIIIQVLKARIAVLPGISAAFNSTVREAMFLELPTVVYETSVTNIVNRQQQVLLEAKMENVEDLGEKMLYAYEHPEEMRLLAANAKCYAINNFSPDAVGKMLSEDIDAILNHYYKQVPIPEKLLLS